MNITIVDRTGREVTCPGRPGESLMTAGVAVGVDGLEGECRGEMACATCIVTVDEDWFSKLPAPSSDEAELLEACERGPFDRLGCQIELSDALDGIRVAATA